MSDFPGIRNLSGLNDLNNLSGLNDLYSLISFKNLLSLMFPFLLEAVEDRDVTFNQFQGS
jgi:hypothetical protein